MLRGPAKRGPNQRARYAGLVLLAALALLPAACRSLRVDYPAAPASDNGWVVSGGSASRSSAVMMPADELSLERRWTRKAPAGFGPGSVVGLHGVIYAGTLKGELVALRLRDGRGLGKRRFGRAMVGAPAVDEHTVFITNAWGRRVLVAHDLRSGRSRWEASGVPIEAGLLFVDSLLIAADIEGVVWALSRQSGAVRWRAPGEPRHGFFSAPVQAGNLIVAADDRGGVRALEVASGRQAWLQDVGMPVLVDLSSNGSDLFIATTRGTLLALDASNGSVRWVFETGDPLVRLTTAAVRDSTVVFGGSDGLVRALDASTGVERWTYPITATVSAPPLIVGETVFVGAHDKMLYGFRLSDGKLTGTTPVEGVVKSAMAFHRSHLIVLSEPRLIHAFRIVDTHSRVDS